MLNKLRNIYYEENNNYLLFGDCLELMKDIPDKSIDMVLCDLPYGNGTHCKWDSVIPFNELWERYCRITKDVGAIVLFGSQPFSSALVMSNLELFRYELIWEKDRISNIFQLRTSFGRIHENILIFSKGNIKYDAKVKMNYFPQNVSDNTSFGKTYMKEDSVHGKQETKKYKMHGKNYPRDILKYKCQQGKLHPTQKPVELCEYLIKTYTKENETVLDNCAGSGTTAIACLNANRHWICIEKEEKYCEISKNRIENYNKI